MSEGNYWIRAGSRRVSRRTAIRGAGIAGVGLAGAALVGCGDDDTPAPGTATPGTGGTATPAPGDGTPAAGEPQRGGTYRATEIQDPPTIDPYANAAVSTKTFAAHVYSRLFKIATEPGVDPFDQLPTPDLAESAETDDGTTWVVTLKQGARFQDLAPVSGKEVTTEDVMFSWQRLTAEESPNSSQVSEITNVEVVDSHTLRFSLDAPTPTFLETIADANLLFIQPTEADGGFDPRTVAIGSGPWILDAYDVSQRIRYRANPDYYVEGLPYLDAIERSIVPEYANRKAQFEAANTEAESIAADDIPEMARRFDALQWERPNTIGMAMVFFSGEELDPDAPWRDERFRQAVSMSLDRRGMKELAANVSELQGLGLDVNDRWNNAQPSTFGPRFWLDPTSEAQGPTSRFFEHNPEEARALLEAVGGGTNPFPYVWTNNRYGATFTLVAESIHEMLTQAGFQPQTEVQDYNSQYITQTFLGNFNGVAYGLESSLTPGGYVERLFGDDPANHGRVRDEQITELHRRQRVEMDEEARTEIFYDIQRRNAEMMFYVPAESSSTGSWVAYQPHVHGWRRTRGYGAGTEVAPHIWLAS